MAFTDDDLKRLKYMDGEGSDVWIADPGELRGLIARLEAAERVCGSIPTEAVTRYPGIFKKLLDAWEAWRKAAGK